MNLHLVIGASGLVGEHLCRAIKDAGYQAVGTYWKHSLSSMHPLDIRDAQAVMALITALQPQVIYLPAALTHVDYCQLHPQDAFWVNVIGVQHVVQAANHCQARVVYFSSDYIFDGLAGPYAETDPANPICEYGRQKLLAEHYVALHTRYYLIVRTTVVYGWEHQGKNFIYRLVNTLKAGQSLQVPIDQVGNPTYAPNLAQATVELVQMDSQGVYHLVGSQRANRYEFACEAARTFGLNESLIYPVTTDQLSQAAPRPLNAGMRVDKAVAKLTTPLIPYRDGLRSLAREREKFL